MGSHSTEYQTTSNQKLN